MNTVPVTSAERQAASIRTAKLNGFVSNYGKQLAEILSKSDDPIAPSILSALTKLA